MSMSQGQGQCDGEQWQLHVEHYVERNRRAQLLREPRILFPMGRPLWVRIKYFPSFRPVSTSTLQQPCTDDAGGTGA